MKLLKLALEERAKPIAVIIKGNPIYIESPNFRKNAEAFYKDVKQRLQQKGYRVQYDAGEDKTIPTTEAKIWLGHSRGASRLRYAPTGIITGELVTKSPHGTNQDHYVLSDADIRMINNLPAA